jgi:hypothetical protein
MNPDLPTFLPPSSAVQLFPRFPALILLIILLALTACSRQPEPTLTEDSLIADTQRIALEYQVQGDLDAAREQIAALDVANSDQWLIYATETSISRGEDPVILAAMAQLADAMGLHSLLIDRYLIQDRLTEVGQERGQEIGSTPETANQPIGNEEEIANSGDAGTSDTQGTEPGTVEPEETALEEVNPEEILEPEATTPEVTDTPTPQLEPIVRAPNAMNVRAGPGTNYPIIGALPANQPVKVLARNQSSDWWQIESADGSTGWVYAPLVETAGDIDAVPVAMAIPTPPPPTATPLPEPTDTPAPEATEPVAPEEPAPTETETPEPNEPAEPEPTPVVEEPGVEYVVASVRLRPIGQDAQNCTGGENSIWVYVEDAQGNPLNGVRVREVFSNRILETGTKGPGRVQYDIYRGGGGQVDIIDGNGNRISQLSRGMSADWPDFDLIKAAGYCNCKPHPDDASCQSDLESKAYLFAVGHYTFEVVFRRTH